MAHVKVLLKGYTSDSDPDSGSSPTITLIKDKDGNGKEMNIIVDPGAVKDRKLIIDALKKESLKIGDIDIVCITHSHMDHYINIGMFPNARALDYWGLWHEDKLDEIRAGPRNFSNDISIIRTPGHNYDNITLLVKTKQGVVAICGDMFWREGYPKDDPYASDMPLLRKTREELLKVADFIIPGHGDMFMALRKT